MCGSKIISCAAATGSRVKGIRIESWIRQGQKMMSSKGRPPGNATMAIRNRKWFLVLVTTAFTVVLVIMTLNRPSYYDNEPPPPTYRRIDLMEDGEAAAVTNYSAKTWRGLPQSTIQNMSTLGRILFLDEKPNPSSQTVAKRHQILVWKYGKLLENRHMKLFSNELSDPFAECSVNNCDITYENADLQTADMVIIHMQRMQGVKDLPEKRPRPEQIWTFLTDESPYHLSLSGKTKVKDFNGVFNWTMTYRMDSDIPVPYGRTVLHSSANIEFKIKKRKDVLIAILGSNCGGKNNRWKYVKELKKHIKVDVYGGCGTLKTCPGGFKSNCDDIDDYLFYLAFENSNCNEYITEKVWWNAYSKNSIPIVMGASKDTYSRILPPNSYLDTSDFARPKDLATYVLYLNSTGKYTEYYQWKKQFKVLNEHGYFGSKSYHYCRACEALNYNSRKTKIYENLGQFWNVTKDCHPAWDA